MGKHLDFHVLESHAKELILDAAKKAIDGPAKEDIVVDKLVEVAVKVLDLDDGTPGDIAGTALVKFFARSIVRGVYRKLRNAGELS